MSDEEIAWRLHQELNAKSPMLRTRSRKAPPGFDSGTLGGSSDEVPASAAMGHVPASKRSSGRGAIRAAVGQESGPVAAKEAEPCGKQLQQQEQQQRRRRQRAQQEQAHCAVEPAGATPEEVKPSLSRPTRGAGSAEGGITAASETTKHPSSPSARGTAKQSADVGSAAAAKPLEAAPADGTAGAGVATARASRHHLQAAPPTLPTGAAGSTHAACDPARPHRSRKSSRPEAATEAGTRHLPPVQPPVAAKPAKPLRTLKVPKLPMVRHNKKWYRCRLLNDSGDKVLVGERKQLTACPAALPQGAVP